MNAVAVNKIKKIIFSIYDQNQRSFLRKKEKLFGIRSEVDSIQENDVLVQKI